MSSLQKKHISGTIEVLYSDMCKRDMNAENQNTSSLIINIIKHTLKEQQITLKEITIPKNRPRNADIYFDIRLDESQIESIKKEIINRVGDNLKSVEIFVDV